MSRAPVRLDRDGDVAIAVFDNAERMNPLSLAFQQGLRDAVAQVREDRSLRALVLAAEGRAFCVGADLSSRDMSRGDAATGSTPGDRVAEAMHTVSNRLILDLRELPVPTVAAVNGACAGAGVGVALACDVVVAAESAYFYLPFIPKLGIVPDLGTTWFVERLVGRGRAMGLTLLNDRLPAQRAVDWGLAWACVADDALRAEAVALARRLAQLPAHGALEARAAYDAAASNGLAAQLAYEAERQRELIDRPSFEEGVTAFLEKRAPRFSPR